MIRILRSHVSSPAALTGDKSPGAKEAARAVRHFTARAQLPPVADPSAAAPAAPATAAAPATPAVASPEKKFKFSAYSDATVKVALSQLFGGKCAYCESRYATTQPMDVEHYRPKARIDGCPDHTGYYWLAASWENLLPSCIDCNRIREQSVPAWEPGADQPTLRTVAVGKGDRFPLLDEQKRALSPEQLEHERPLLLNPCLDDPDQFLAFDDDAFVHPRSSDADDSLQRGAASIHVYALNRAGLVQTRLEVLRLVQARIYTISRLVEILDQGVSPHVADLVEDLLTHELEQLKQFRSPRQPYTLMCRQLIDAFLDPMLDDISNSP